MRQNVKYCGQELPHRFDSQRNTLEIRFKSDGENGRRGFKLQYSLQSKISLRAFFLLIFRVLLLHMSSN